MTSPVTDHLLRRTMEANPHLQDGLDKLPPNGVDGISYKAGEFVGNISEADKTREGDIPIDTASVRFNRWDSELGYLHDLHVGRFAHNHYSTEHFMETYAVERGPLYDSSHVSPFLHVGASSDVGKSIKGRFIESCGGDIDPDSKQWRRAAR